VKFARLLSCALWLVGLLAGTWGASPATTATAAPRRAAGYWILAADFHVHAFPGDGALPPWVLRQEIARAGLDVFTLSNHNRVSTARTARWLARDSAGPIVIVGQEVTARGYHMIAAGIEERVSWDTRAVDAIRAVHEQGGVAIVAHPYRRFWPAWDDEALAIADGYERAHPGMDRSERGTTELASFDQHVRERRPHIAPIGSSDFHWTGGLGWCRTYVLARERTQAGVLDAVREGRTVAADTHGRLYGDPQLVAIVDAAGGFIPAAPADRWRPFSLAAAWLGLLGMLVFGSPKPASL
jgi:predicted metal-dependent phosphoesterase TrpH